MDGLVALGFIVVGVIVVAQAWMGGGHRKGGSGESDSSVGIDPYMPGTSVWKRHDD
jgi:hypothetical protein